MKNSIVHPIALLIAVPAFAVLVGGIVGLTFAIIAGLCLSVVAITWFIREQNYQAKHRRSSVVSSLGDYLIARSIVLRAYNRGVIDRSAYLKGELFIERELNLNNLIVGVVRKSRTQSTVLVN